MKKWKIPVTWEVSSVISVEANSLEEAMEIAEDKTNDIPCPRAYSYVDGSWKLESNDEDFIREYYNGNAEDETK